MRMNKSSEILAIKSNKQELQKVEEFLNRIFVEKNLPKKCFNKVFLCITEAVINSIEHGNKNDDNKEVAIQVKCPKDLICIKVSDSGDGFDYTNVDDPTSEKNLLKETGRGIHILKSLCTQVNFQDHGKCVEIKIDLK